MKLETLEQLTIISEILGSYVTMKYFVASYSKNWTKQFIIALRNIWDLKSRWTFNKAQAITLHSNIKMFLIMMMMRVSQIS